MRSSADRTPSYPVLTQAEAKKVRSYTTKKGREESSRFLVEGWKNVGEALDAGWSPELVIVETERERPPSAPPVLERLQSDRIKVRSASHRTMSSLAMVDTSQGIIACLRQRTWSVQDIIGAGGKVILVLDGVSDPGNVGTLIRTAAWFGTTGVILGPGCASPFNEKSVRSTSGALFRVRLCLAADLREELEQLRFAGYEVVGTDARGTGVAKLPAAKPIAIVLGSEAHGMSQVSREFISTTISIPGNGKVESLNVAAAGAVMLYMISLRAQ